jgi:heptosyltransferase-1
VNGDGVKSNRVLIVRIGAMGDVLHAMPAVAALRKAHPEWFLGWAVEPRWMPLLQAVNERSGSHERGSAMPLVDRTYPVETKKWKKKPLALETLREIRSLRAVLRSERFDLCVDLQGSIRSAVIGRMSGARELVGPADPREREARLLYGRKVEARGQHVVEQWCDVLGGAVGEPLSPERVELPVDKAADENCENLLRRFGLEGERLVMISPTAGWGAKQWPAERFGQVAAELGRHGWKVVVNAADLNDPVAQEVVRVSEGNATALAGDLSTLIALTRRAELMIGGDTGPVHLAAALGLLGGKQVR